MQLSNRLVASRQMLSCISPIAQLHLHFSLTSIEDFGGALRWFWTYAFSWFSVDLDYSFYRLIKIEYLCDDK